MLVSKPGPTISLKIINEIIIAIMIAIKCVLYVNQNINKMNVNVAMSEIAINAQLKNDRFIHIML
jgi:hypothetical protein